MALKKIAILCSPDMMPGSARKNPYDLERQEQLDKLVPALERVGICLERVDWHDCLHRRSEFDAMLPLFTWDYWDHHAKFVQTLRALSAHVPVLNSASIIEWNADKIYLTELDRQGVDIVPMQVVDRVTPKDIETAFTTFQTERLVLKPRVGGGGFGQAVLIRGEALDEGKLPAGPTIIQPFLTSVQSEGEVTTVWFGEQFSHALRKVPKPGEYRVQSHYGGREEPFTASDAHIDIARAALKALPEPPLYARIDLLRGNDSAIKVSEVELVEPYFYLAMAPGDIDRNIGANLFARKLAERLQKDALPCL